MTVLRFSGGEAVEVGLSLQEAQDLIQRALAAGVMLELHAPDGRELIINPQQVQYLQNSADLEADANGGATTDASPAVPA